MSKNHIAADSAALTLVKLFTMATSIVSAMILSRTLPLAEYGTYSTGNLLISTATSISAFGLLDAVNYYYNGKAVKDRDSYINTVIALVMICGLIMSSMIFLGRDFISNYFHNPALASIYNYIIFRPILANLGGCFQNLQVSIGKAKVVAFRNGLISISKLTVVIFTAFYTHNIITIFACIFVVEILTVLLYYIVLKNNSVCINPLKCDFSKVKEILIYCIPMGIYIQANVISRDLDKFVIGFFENTDYLAIYTNCSTKLPLDILSNSLLVVVIPILTRCIRSEDYKNAVQLYRGNIKIGCTFTLTFGTVLMVLARQAIQFLYGDKYLPGLGIFMLYIVVDMLNFVSFPLVLAAKGRTKILMFAACAALLTNLILNFIFYFAFGFIGPAIATVIVTFVTNMILLKLSSNILHVQLQELFDFRYMTKLFIELAVAAISIYLLRQKANELGIHYFATLIVLGGLGAGGVLTLNFKELMASFRSLNQMDGKQSMINQKENEGTQ